MEFIITRTSMLYAKPCDNAYEAKHPDYHIRTCTEEQFNERFSSREGLWRSKGKDHCITEEGFIERREKDKKCWTIKIESMEELESLSKNYGPLVVDMNTYKDESPTIEIYDDYRE